MSLSIRQWLAEHNIQFDQLTTAGAKTTGVAFRLIQDMQVKSLTTFDICPFAEILELPWGVAWPQMQPTVQLSVEMLRLLNRKKPLKRNEGTWLAFQIAYLRALDKILEQESILRRPWLDRGSILAVSPAEPGRQVLSDPPLQALLKTVSPGRLSDTQAEQALSQIGESFLVQQMNNVAIAWFTANGAEDIEARTIVQRLVYGLPGYLLEAIAENALPLAQLQKFVRLGNLTNFREAVTRIAPVNPSDPENLDINVETELAQLAVPLSAPVPIDFDRENYRATLLKNLCNPVLEELFALKDLYIPLKGKEISHEETNSDESEKQPDSTVDLMEWATKQLADVETVAAIEAPPGCGKTSFCQIWAAKVAQELYPSWIPVLIRLRDATLGHTLEQTLDTAFPEGRFTSADGWLSPLHPPCLLILDGLDELPKSPQAERHLSTFLQQVKQFLSQSPHSPGRPRHKIVLTCRSGHLVGPYSNQPLQPRTLPPQFRRIAIQPLEQEQLKHWFKQWSKLQSKSIAQAFFNFLKLSGVFHFRSDVKEIATLVHQPLMLLLLGLLYRDRRIDESILPLPGPQVRFEIHDRLCRWLLGEPPDGMSNSQKMPVPMRDGLAHACRSPEAIANLLEGRSPQELRQQMQAAALTLLQSGQLSITTTAHHAHPPTLPAFYFRQLTSPNSIQNPGIKIQNRIEFSHPRLGDYLIGDAIAFQLKALTQPIQDIYGEDTFDLDSPVEVAQHLYNLLSFGILSQEVEELVIERLRREEARDRISFSFEVLFERLYRFYRSYCRGRWLDGGMAHGVREKTPASNPLNTLQIDAAVGFNVFLLLCACQREALVPFWPCGDPAITEEYNPDQLLTLIGRTAVLSPIAFWQRSKPSFTQLNLARACLHSALLAGANFWKTNLFAAELVGANLAGANLQEANLSWANLTGANLTAANLTAAKLEGANLTGANLRGATLQLANLTNACLENAQLDDATKDFAEKNGALFSLKQYQACQKALNNLDLPRNTRVDDADDDSDSTLLLIERAQGSIVPPTQSEEEMSAETVFLE
jgi:arsenate reductase-like glutaredoxin family protein